VRQRWREEASRGGGLLFDLGPHLIDQALALFGPPQTVSATVRTHRDQASAPDYVHIQLGYGGSEVVLHASALTALIAPRFAIHGTRGSYVKYELDTQEDQLKAGLRPGDDGFGAGNAAGIMRVLEGDREVEREVPTRNGDYVGFYVALADAIQNGVKFPVSPQDAVDVMTIIELAARSSEEGIRLPFERIR
jgi:predicted dehydrogenase